MSEASDRTAEKIKNKRAAKKGSITKRINEMMQLINDNGSRTKVKFMLEKLFVVRDEAIALDKELATLTLDHDDSWIEGEKERCDTIEGDVKEYLESRAGDAPSSVGYTESWAMKLDPERDSLVDDPNFVSSEQAHKFSMRPPQFTGPFDMGGQYMFSSLPCTSYPPVPPMTMNSQTCSAATTFGNKLLLTLQMFLILQTMWTHGSIV